MQARGSLYSPIMVYKAGTTIAKSARAITARNFLGVLPMAFSQTFVIIILDNESYVGPQLISYAYTLKWKLDDADIVYSRM